MSQGPLLRVEGLSKRLPGRKGRASRDLLQGVSLTLEEGASIALLGRSGAGKTTLARAILGLTAVDAGRVEFQGDDLLTMGRRELRVARRQLQLIFQDPAAALDPRQRVGEALCEPLRAHGLATGHAARRAAAGWLERIGLPSDAFDRWPHELSGGERQRVGVARTMILQPRLVIADEPVSALDPWLRREIMELVQAGTRERGAGLLLITHDLSLLASRVDRVAVLADGRIVEEGPAEEVLRHPAHQETARIVQAERLLDLPYPRAGRAV